MTRTRLQIHEFIISVNDLSFHLQNKGLWVRVPLQSILVKLKRFIFVQKLQNRNKIEKKPNITGLATKTDFNAKVTVNENTKNI